MILVREEEREQAERKKKRLLTLYIVVACLYVAAALLLLFLSPDKYLPFMIVDMVLTVAFGFFSIFFFTVPYDLAVKRYRLLNKVFTALSEREFGVFLREENPLTYEGVEMRTLLFRVRGDERALHLLQGEVSLEKGKKYLLEIHTGVIIEIGEQDGQALS